MKANNKLEIGEWKASFQSNKEHNKIIFSSMDVFSIPLNMMNACSEPNFLGEG